MLLLYAGELQQEPALYKVCQVQRQPQEHIPVPAITLPVGPELKPYVNILALTNTLSLVKDIGC